MSKLEARKRRVVKTGMPSLFRHCDKWVVVFQDSNGQVQVFESDALEPAQALCEYHREKHVNSLVSPDHDRQARAWAELQKRRPNGESPLLLFARDAKDAEEWAYRYKIRHFLVVTPDTFPEVLNSVRFGRGVFAIDDVVLPAWSKPHFLRMFPGNGVNAGFAEEKLSLICIGEDDD